MDFYDLALAKFLQSFPELGNYIVTFQDLSEQLSNSEDSEVSIGCFIIKAGKSYFYIPVIAKGANLYPIDSMFSMDKQKFMPLTPKTVTSIVNSNSFSLGSAEKIPRNVPRNPSVYDLVTPPRTGKFVYASSSRLTEFLHIIPNDIKSYVKNAIVNNKKMYNGFNNLFGLKEILEPLSTPHAPVITADVTPKGASVITEGSGCSEDEIKAILSTGYAIRGSHSTSRIAVAAENFNSNGRMQQAGFLEENKEYTVVKKDGSVIDGFVPRVSRLKRPFSDERSNVTFMLYENGDFSTGNNQVIQGTAKEPVNVLTTLFNSRPPVMLKNLEGGESFALFTPDMDLIGVYRVDSSSIRNNEGVILKDAHSLQNHLHVDIFGYRNVKAAVQEGHELYIPYDTLVVLLSHNISHELEVNVNSASKKRSLAELVALGASMDVGYDGVEFSVNGSPIGGEPKIMDILVSHEGIDPSVASSFVKQAKEQRKVKIYLSKKADFSAGEIPQFGQVLPEQQPDSHAQDGKGITDFEPNVQASLGVGDAQTTEATILAELLQAPDMFEYIEEYMPDIEECLDKLGRILFLLRINLDKFGKGNNPNEVFSFISQLRNVYRMMGDSYIKLQQMIATTSVANGKEE